MHTLKTLLVIIITLTASFMSAQNDMLLLKSSGKVVIGDTALISTPGNYNLYVQNGILTERVKVALRDQSEWKDDAFNKTPTLSQVKTSIGEHNHLYNMPSASTLVKEGYELKAMDAKLLEQIEWLWQHVIALEEENNRLKKQLEASDKDR